MHMRGARAAKSDVQGITGSARSHIISRLARAVKVAQELFNLLDDASASGTRQEDILEAQAYASSLQGSYRLEKRQWQECLESYSVAQTIYSVILVATKKDVFRDIVSTWIDPNLRYAGYKAQVPRSEPIASIVRNHFPRSDKKLVNILKKFDPEALGDRATPVQDSTEQLAAPETVTWRGRTVKLEDAAIALALASVSTAAVNLTNDLNSPAKTRLSPKERAAAYDGLLNASQDAVDATRHAIEELLSEEVGQSDRKMQSLQITRTALEYNLIGWRVGRNRTLIGNDDGLLADGDASKSGPQDKDDEKARPERRTRRGKMLSQLRESIALYDATIQVISHSLYLEGMRNAETSVGTEHRLDNGPSWGCWR